MEAAGGLTVDELARLAGCNAAAAEVFRAAPERDASSCSSTAQSVATTASTAPGLLSIPAAYVCHHRVVDASAFRSAVMKTSHSVLDPQPQPSSAGARAMARPKAPAADAAFARHSVLAGAAPLEAVAPFICATGSGTAPLTAPPDVPNPLREQLLTEVLIAAFRADALGCCAPRSDSDAPSSAERAADDHSHWSGCGGGDARVRFAPVVGYHAASDSVLLLDTARREHAPFWVPVPQLWRAMAAADPRTRLPNGFVVLRRRAAAPLLLFHDSPLGPACKSHDAAAAGAAGAAAATPPPPRAPHVCLNTRLRHVLATVLQQTRSQMLAEPCGESGCCDTGGMCTVTKLPGVGLGSLSADGRPPMIDAVSAVGSAAAAVADNATDADLPAGAGDGKASAQLQLALLQRAVKLFVGHMRSHSRAARAGAEALLDATIDTAGAEAAADADADAAVDASSRALAAALGAPASAIDGSSGSASESEFVTLAPVRRDDARHHAARAAASGTGTGSEVLAVAGAGQSGSELRVAAGEGSPRFGESRCVSKLSREHIATTAQLLRELEATPIFDAVTVALEHQHHRHGHGHGQGHGQIHTAAAPVQLAAPHLQVAASESAVAATAPEGGSAARASPGASAPPTKPARRRLPDGPLDVGVLKSGPCEGVSCMRIREAHLYTLLLMAWALPHTHAHPHSQAQQQISGAASLPAINTSGQSPLLVQTLHAAVASAASLASPLLAHELLLLHHELRQTTGVLAGGDGDGETAPA